MTLKKRSKRGYSAFRGDECHIKNDGTLKFQNREQYTVKVAANQISV